VFERQFGIASGFRFFQRLALRFEFLVRGRLSSTLYLDTCIELCLRATFGNMPGFCRLLRMALRDSSVFGSPKGLAVSFGAFLSGDFGFGMRRRSSFRRGFERLLGIAP
jgi:hypothetical protein